MADYKLDPAVQRALKKKPSSAATRLEAGGPVLQRRNENAPAPNALDQYLEQLRANRVQKEADQAEHERVVANRQSDRALQRVGGIGNVIGEDADPEAVKQLNDEVNSNPLLVAQQDPEIRARYEALMAQKEQEETAAPKPEKRWWESRSMRKAPTTASPAHAPNPFDAFVERFAPPQRQQQPIAPYYSDEKNKGAKKGNELDDLLAALKESASTYTYNDPSMNPSEGKGEGQRYAGVMAQRLEAVPGLGKGLVSDTPTGKVVEGKASLSAALAAIGRQQQQIEELKKGRK